MKLIAIHCFYCINESFSNFDQKVHDNSQINVFKITWLNQSDKNLEKIFPFPGKKIYFEVIEKSKNPDS